MYNNVLSMATVGMVKIDSKIYCHSEHDTVEGTLPGWINDKYVMG